jgi:hypothetical protein
VGKNVMEKSKEAVDITTDQELEAAVERAREHDNDPLAKTMKYIADHDLVIIGLNDGRRLILPIEDLPELKGLTRKQFENWELLGGGIAINFPDIDVALPIDGILDGTYGRRRWMSEMGVKGGQVKTKAKAEAARLNGAKGGRPRTREILGPNFGGPKPKVAAKMARAPKGRRSA